jgi:hypothetical protein
MCVVVMFQLYVQTWHEPVVARLQALGALDTWREQEEAPLSARSFDTRSSDYDRPWWQHCYPSPETKDDD